MITSLRGLPLLFVVACGSDPEPACPGPPTVELGTGVDAWVPVRDGDEVQLVMGPQGGFHLTHALRLCEIPQPVKLHVVTTVPATGATVSDVAYERTGTAVEGDTCCVEILDITGFVFVAGDTGMILWPPDELDGEVVLIDIEIEDLDGRIHGVSRRVTVQAP